MKKAKSLQCELYDWLSSMECARIKKKCGIITFTNEMYEASVIFHDNNLIELSIEEKKTGEIPFYLHFEAYEKKSARDNIQAFFDFFMDKKPAKENLDSIVVKNERPLKLLVSCTSGMTSSYFAYTMKKVLNNAGIDVTIDAVSYREIDRIQSEYDYILLAPQIAYMLKEYQKKYGNKVMAVESKDFASYNVKRVINHIVHRDSVRVA